jgi:hypothetical protein
MTKTPPPETPDGRRFVARGRCWPKADSERMPAKHSPGASRFASLEGAEGRE